MRTLRRLPGRTARSLVLTVPILCLIGWSVASDADAQTVAPAPAPASPKTPASRITQPVQTAARSRAVSPSRLARAIDAVIGSGDNARAYWGITFRDVKTGAIVYERNANALFIPASNLKLVVSAMAAHDLDPAFRFHTGIYARGSIRNGVLSGDLILRGRGDPLISGRYEASRTAIFERWADSLRAHGITRVDGQIVADQTYFDEAYVRGDWEAYDLNWWYAAPVAALGFNDNSIDFRVAPGVGGTPAQITWEPQTHDFVFVNRTHTAAAAARYTLDFDRIPGTDTVYAYGEIPRDAAVRSENFSTRDPGKYAGAVLRETLERQGIAVTSPLIRVVDQPAASPSTDATLLFDYTSPPLPQVFVPILQNSQNWIAEMLLKTVAREVSGDGSWDAGLALERRFLIDNVHADSGSFHLRDASGLSSTNLVSPALLADVFRYIVMTPEMKMVYDALSVSGAETGSLRQRFTDLTGRVRGKTGTISNVDSLTGIVDTDSGRRLVFSIIVNNSGQPSARVRDAVDRIVRLAAKS